MLGSEEWEKGARASPAKRLPALGTPQRLPGAMITGVARIYEGCKTPTHGANP